MTLLKMFQRILQSSLAMNNIRIHVQVMDRAGYSGRPYLRYQFIAHKVSQEGFHNVPLREGSMMKPIWGQSTLAKFRVISISAVSPEPGILGVKAKGSGRKKHIVTVMVEHAPGG